MKAIRSLLLVVFFLMAARASAADWPQWQGPNRDGVSQDAGLLKKWPPEGPKLLWTFEKTGVGFSGPAVVGDKLFILGADDPEKGDKEFALCVDVKTGKEVWRKPLDTSAGNYSYMWGIGPRSTPTVDGEHVYVLGAKGDLQCLRTADGSKVWGVNFVKDFGAKAPAWGFCESVLIDGDRLICTPGGNKGTIACVEKKSGKVIWRSTDLTDEAQYSSIVISNVGVKQYITLLKSGTVSVRGLDGKLLWKSKAGANGVAVIPTAIVHDKYVFATSGYGSGCGLLELTPEGADNVKMKEVYLNKAITNHHGGVVRVGDYIYGYSENGNWLCLDYLKLDKENEKPLWKSKKLPKGSLIYADGNLYCLSQNKEKEIKGVCALVEANPKSEWNEHGRFELPKQSSFPRRSSLIWTHPVIANGMLFLRDHEYLFCYDIKQLD